MVPALNYADEILVFMTDKNVQFIVVFSSEAQEIHTKKKKKKKLGISIMLLSYTLGINGF